MPFEHDYDRLLFSTPVRRLADKTQVFPLERNDSIRTRLTHSHEVSNLARSIGNRLVRAKPGIFGDKDADRAAPVILAAVGLAHDLGNPPFGHQGENAIRSWFKTNHCLFKPEGGEEVSRDYQNDFLQFEGNAQTLRLVTRLQVSVGGFGLDLTAATLAALMKYTVPSWISGDHSSQKSASSKKPGYFASEEEIVRWIRESTGLKEGERHPLTWLMEACDDIAYSILDVEDSIKKSLVSPEDVLAYLKRVKQNPILKSVVDTLDADFETANKKTRSSQASEIKTSYLRTRLIETLITGGANTFLDNHKEIFEHSNHEPLLERQSPYSEIYKYLKGFAQTYAYRSPAVMRVELQGAIVISKLMDWFWRAITERKDYKKLACRRINPFASYVYTLISDNYRCEFEESEGVSNLPIRYREMQLLTDMISGMTDGFAMQLYKDLEPLSRD